MLARSLLCLALAAFPALGVAAAQASAVGESAETALRAFQDAVFLSTRAHTVDGRHAVDLYWKAQEKCGGRAGREIHSCLGSLYTEIHSDYLARAVLTEQGWEITAPHGQFTLAQGQPFSGLLVLLSNQTSRLQNIALEFSGKSITAPRQQVQLAPGETQIIAPALRGVELGAFRSQLRILGSHSTRIAIAGDVRQAVRLRVHTLDASGAPTPARIYLHGADGFSHTPEGAFERIMWMTGEHFFYTSGTLEVVLPAGPVRIEVRKGFDYAPVEREFDLSPGKDADVSVPLPELKDMNAAGWYSGDDHIHGNYTGEQWSTPQDDLLVVQAEGLNVGNMMVSNSVRGTIHDERYFEGKPHALSTRNEVLYWNQEMRTWSYGHLLLLNLKRLVRPLYTGFPESEQWEDYPSNDSQARQARDQGGIALYAHPALRFDQVPTGSLGGEAVADVALGSIDGFEVFCSHDEPSMELWYRFLNLGFRLGISGGSDAFLNQSFSFLAGGERVYVYTGHRFDYESWARGLREGRSFATVGPLVTFQVNGALPGSTLHLQAGPEKNSTKVHVQVEAVSVIPITKVEVIARGRVVAIASSPSPAQRLQWQGEVPLEESAWLAARVWAENSDRISNGPSRWSERRSNLRVLAAHTSPIYVLVGNQPIYSAEDRDFCLRWMDALIQRIGKDGKFAGPTHRQEVLSSFARARAVYQNMGTAPQEKQ